MGFLEQGRETKRRRCLKDMEKKKRPFIITIKQAWKYSCTKIPIPNDIFEDILMKLAVKSLIRFQTLSKHTKSLIRSSGFQERYMSYHQTKDPKLFFISDSIVNRRKKSLFFKTMTLEEERASLEHTRPLNFKDFKGEFLEVSESCDGLVCIHDVTIPVKVMNPASGMSISLPLAKIQQLLIDHPHPGLKLVPAAEQGPVQFRAFIRFGFGKDDVTGRYKLVCLYNQYPAASTSTSSTVCEVLDLEEKKWRFVNTTTLDHHHVLNSQRPAFANGSFYWLTSGDEEGYPTPQTKLIVFDIHTEMFQLLPTPPFITPHVSGDKIGVCNLDGRLCISRLNKDCKQEFWWRASDKAKWEKIFSVDLHSTSAWFGGITSEPLTPLAISRDTNKVILSLSYRDNLVAFDLRPHSPVYHLYHSGYYGIAVPYFPSLLLSRSNFGKFVPLF